MDQSTSKEMIGQLRRQSLWLKDSWQWVLNTKVIGKKRTTRMSALEVGCGPGFVMDITQKLFEVQGLDLDPDMVSMCKARGQDVVLGRAEDLPFGDQEFDVVYCSFLLLLVKDPVAVVKEMKSVSRKWVITLAEPDYGAWIDHPKGLAGLKEVLIEGMRATGADPFLGRKLRDIFEQAGLKAEIGAHAGVWDLDRLKEEFDDQRRLVRSLARSAGKTKDLDTIEDAWKEALKNGTLFHYNPIFYSVGKRK
jgi:SAM-dependent methyltransferase